MKILYVAHSFPYPLHEGVRLHVYQLLKYLSVQHEIHFLCFIESPDERKSLDQISGYCRSVTTILHHVPKHPWRRVFNILLQPWPFSVYQYESRTMADSIKEQMSRLSPDVVHFDFTVMASYAKLAAGTARVFFPHDAMSMLFARNEKQESRFLPKLYWRSQTAKMQRYEKSLLRTFDRTVVVSPVDRDVLQSAAPTALIENAPNGVDSDYFAPIDRPEAPATILFRGIMSFPPNYDAASFFATEVMPLIWKGKPEAIFQIVGANPPAMLKQLAENDRRIHLTGFVEDLRVAMQEATVIVSPMRSGSGIKNKVLESLAMAKAVVATPMSLAGIKAVANDHLLIGETPDQLSDQTLRLLNDATLRATLGRQGRAFVIEQHSWKHHADQFTAIYQDAVNAHAKGQRT